MYDLCVVGGGASGIACAITAAKRGKKIILLEKNAKLGKKLYATGNGRCNITNERFSDIKNFERAFWIYQQIYHSLSDDYEVFLSNAIGMKPYADINSFLESIGICTTSKNGYIYPKSMQASSFVWALTDALKENNADIRLKTKVKCIKKADDFFEVETENEKITAKNVLIACGGKSVKSLGGCDDGFCFAESFSHNVNKPYPALCGIYVEENLKAIAGVRTNAIASLCDDEDGLYGYDEGELQITEEKLSGIMIFNIASRCGKWLHRGKKLYINIDFLPDDDEEQVLSFFRTNNNRTIYGNLNAYLNDKLALYIISQTGLNEKEPTCNVSDDELKLLIEKVKECRFNVKGISDFENSQVTAGGVSLSELDYNFMSKRVDGLYFAGEVTDIDGICGGYNITYAILSGIKVGLSI